MDLDVVKKSFNFATKRGLQLFYVSASDGTNVVQLFEKAIDMGVECIRNPGADDIVGDVIDLLREDDPKEEEEKKEE